MVDRTIQKITKEIKQIIAKELNPKSIILTGSFGKGEVIYNINKKPVFISDCEIIVIPKLTLNRKKMKEISNFFLKKYKLEVSFSGYKDIIYLKIPYLNKYRRKTIWYYDLKYGSKIIYGKNYTKSIPTIDQKDIDKLDCIRQLFNRISSYMDITLEKPKENRIYKDKILFAIIDYILVINGTYTPKYELKHQEIQTTINKYKDKIDVNYFLRASEIADKRRKNTFIKNNSDYKINKILKPFLNNILYKDIGVNNEYELRDQYIKANKKYNKFANLKMFFRLSIRKKIRTVSLTRLFKTPLNDYILSYALIVYLLEKHKQIKISKILEDYEKISKIQIKNKTYKKVILYYIYLWRLICK